MTKISLDSLISHGKVTANLQDGILQLTTQSSITSIAYNLTDNSYKRHYLELPQRAQIPFTLSMQLKLDYSGLILLIGQGHILFNCPSNRSIEDIEKPSGKPLPALQFCNRLPTDRFVSVKISYCAREMQILIDGREAFYSTKQPYMKSVKQQRPNTDSLQIGLEVAKLSTLCIKEIELTELSPDCALQRPTPYIGQEHCETNSEQAQFASPLEEYIARFSPTVQEELRVTDAFLKGQKILKMKRSIDSKGGKLTYTASDYGISYCVRNVCGEAWQSFSFYIVTAGKAETWHRKADYMEETLQEIGKTNPALANRIFFALNDCVGCYGTRCIVKTVYSYGGKKKLACHGVVMLRLCHEDFCDVREFFDHFAKLMERKTAEGTLQNEAIYLLRKK